MTHHLSYLMGADQIADSELAALGITLVGKTKSGSRKLQLQEGSLGKYTELVRNKMDTGFWNEILGEKEILFIFKFKDGHIEEYTLSPANHQQISDLCMEFNHEPPGKTAIVYKYLSENDFYHDFMLEHYGKMIPQ